MPTRTQIIKVPDIKILGTQGKKCAAARQAEIRKTHEYIRVKQTNEGQIRKAPQ